MATRQHTPTKDFAEFVAQHDPLVTTALLRISRRSIRSEADLLDLKQAVYLRIWETNYLDRYDATKGKFSTYIWAVARSVFSNWCDKNSRDPLNFAKGIIEVQPQDGRKTGRVSLNSHPAFRDEAWEGRQVTSELLRRFETFAETVADGAQLIAVLRLLHAGHTYAEVARQLDLPPSAVTRVRKRLQVVLGTRLRPARGPYAVAS